MWYLYFFVSGMCLQIACWDFVVFGFCTCCRWFVCEDLFLIVTLRKTIYLRCIRLIGSLNVDATYLISTDRVFVVNWYLLTFLSIPRCKRWDWNFLWPKSCCFVFVNLYHECYRDLAPTIPIKSFSPSGCLQFLQMTRVVCYI